MTTPPAPPVVLVCGLLLWALANNGRAKEIGRAGVWVCLLWLTYGLTHVHP